MGSKSKFQRASSSSEDRISSLPDSVLCQILSLIPTKFVVATSVLSTRWKYLWTSIPNLDLDDSLIYTGNSDRNPRERKSFMNFVERMLESRDSSITLDKFSLRCGGDCDLDRVKEWVCAAIGQNAKEIDLGLNLRHLFQLPICFFISQTVVILKLNWKILVDIPSEICFSNLKALHFNGVKFSDYESVEKILSGCPVLEELVIRKCKWVQGRTLSICALTLSDLTLEDTHALESGGDHECEIVIDAPALKYLAIRDYTSEKFVVKNLCSIVEAHVDVAQNSNRFVPDGEYGNRVLELLKSVSTVKFLSLSHGTMEAIRYAYDNTFPAFINLTVLELGADAWSGWVLLPNLLASSPILEYLVFGQGLIQHLPFGVGTFHFNWYPPEHVPECLLFHLKEIEIRNFRGTALELVLVKYLLKNAKVLRKMSIDCSLSKEGPKLHKKLLTLQRGSAACYLDLTF